VYKEETKYIKVLKWTGFSRKKKSKNRKEDIIWTYKQKEEINLFVRKQNSLRGPTRRPAILATK
jgi:hypothetical protein